MDDLHKALLVKVYTTVMEADRQWSRGERVLASVLIEHLWNRRLEGDELRDAVRKISQQSQSLKWYTVVRPFDRIAPLREHVGELESLVLRLAHCVARIDGKLHPREAERIRFIEAEIQLHLRPIPIDQPGQHQEAERLTPETIKSMQEDAADVSGLGDTPSTSGDVVAAEAVHSQTNEPTPAERLEEALAELDELIGMQQVKQEVRSLANFLKVQKLRQQSGLPTTPVSLHIVFRGNPGTGKTTVARILGHVLGALGVLRKGHLVETDRAGLVAEYAGQTGPKTNKKIDEALDGVLFIDEAYSLVANQGDDPYGREAVQTLLKRMEDDRERIVVVLAGYPQEMQQLLTSNPGLSSRFNRQFDFNDYQPSELAAIFGALCERNRYTLTPTLRAKLLLGLEYLYQNRDRHFGNGRLVRNLFELAIRRLADRIVALPDLDHAELTQLQPGDLELARVPEGVSARADDPQLRFLISCPGCDKQIEMPTRFFAKRVRCKECQHAFTPEWGDPLSEE